MKKSILILALALVLSFCASTALAGPEGYMFETLDDFSVTAIDGSSFTLSESLKTHDLVLINFWATWCPPCRQEFPYLEKAWKQYGDRVDVIALTVEPDDSVDVLKSFAKKNKLTFAIGSDESDIFFKLNGEYIPTTLIVNKSRTIVAVEVGGKGSVDEFTSLFDSLLKKYGSPVNESPASSTSASTSTSADGRKVRINNGSSPNVRSEPSASGEKVGNAKSGQTYELLDEMNNWYKIRLENGTEGWISGSMAKIVD